MVKIKTFVHPKGSSFYGSCSSLVLWKAPICPQSKRNQRIQNLRQSLINLNLEAFAMAATLLRKHYAAETQSISGFVRAGYGILLSHYWKLRTWPTEVNELKYALQLNHQSFGKGPVLDEPNLKRAHTNLGFWGELFLDPFEGLMEAKMEAGSIKFMV